jgi:hypothetical protein
MKKKYNKPQLTSVSLDTDVVLFMVSEPNQYQHRQEHGHNVHDDVHDNAFGGKKPFPDQPQYY